MERNEQVLSLLWAKKRESAEGFLWLPLVVHLKDTAGVMRFLWQHWVSAGQKKIISRSLKGGDIDKESMAENLVCFLAAVHDLGKCTPVFQTQKGYQNSQDLDAALLERLERAGFTGLTEIAKNYFDEDARKRSHHTVVGEFLLRYFGVRQDIASIVGAHHGKPVDTEIVVTNLRVYPAYCFQEEQGICKEIWLGMQKRIIEDALKENGFVNSRGEADISLLPEVSMPAQVLFSGLIIMADWIASNEEYFPLIRLEEEVPRNIDGRLQAGMKKWCRQNPVDLLEIIGEPCADAYYQKRFGFMPRDFQRKIFDTIANTDEPGIFILEAPMGGGKTEAALAAAEELMAKKKFDGLFFGLPTQATSNGIFPRINEWLENLADEYGAMEKMKLMHGKAALNTIQEELLAGLHVDEEYGSGVLTAQWFAGKKTAILSDAVVGTVDHFLLTALKQKHLALRHLGFSKKIVIIDEVHAYDAYMEVFLSCAIEWMAAYGIPVVLLSATLPAEIRKTLILAYLRGQVHGIGKKGKGEYAAVFQSESYPLLTYTDKGKIYQEKDFVKEKDWRITVHKLAEENLAELLKSLLAHGGIAGIIVNTVRRAQNLFGQLSEIFGSDVHMLHAKFIDTDRMAKEKLLLECIGKGAERPQRAIIIGTQVLEQSLDIDFDVLITDLCPMDLLLQRTGRLHRHKISRPQGLSKPALYVMGQSDTLEFDRGSSAVYGDYLLARTQRMLPASELFVPRDISPLVQRVYGEEKLSWEDGVQETYDKAKENYEEKVQKEDDKAKRQFLLKKPQLEIKPEKYNLIGWLRTAAVPDSEENAFAQVRNAEESIEVIALLKCGAGYGFFDKKEDISDRIENYETTKEVAKRTLKLSALTAREAFGGVSQTIDWLENYNRKTLHSWQQQLWLKGSLGILFEPAGDGKTGEFCLGDVILSYSCELGLQVRKKKDGDV